MSNRLNISNKFKSCQEQDIKNHEAEEHARKVERAKWLAENKFAKCKQGVDLPPSPYEF